MARPPFPQTISEFQAWFGTEDACLRYLVSSRWPDGFFCPRCAHGKAYELISRRVLKCQKCGYQASVIAGTVMHGTHLPVRQWFWAAYLVATYTPGISAVQLQRQLGLSRYETAWAILQKLRRAMVRPERDRIAGTVEVDETYVGGLDTGRRGGRQRDGGKATVVGAVEIRGPGSGRIRMGVVEDVSADSLAAFVEGAIVPGSIVLTDGWKGYACLKKKGYDHRPKTQGRREDAAKHLPRVHRVFSNLKTWLSGTHHGVRRKHLPHYLNEFVFRFNRRKTPMAAFQTLLGLAAQQKPTSYKMLYHGESTG